MRRSSQVVAPLLASAAMALLTACKQTEMERCVDEQNHVVDPKFCQNIPATQQQPNTLYNGAHPGVPLLYPYHLYYGGGGGYGFGSIATGGSTAPIAGHSYSTSSGTTRGGFGGFFSGGGGEGGGAGE